MVKPQCSACGKPFSPEERLLIAIFGAEALCKDCYEKQNASKCVVCGAVTVLYLNGKPRCKEHMWSAGAD